MSISQKQRRQVGLPSTIASVAFFLAVIALIVWQSGGVMEDSGQLQVLHPNLAMAWRVMFVALLILDIVLALAVWRTRRWTLPLAVINILASIVSTVALVVLLLRGHLLAPDLPQQLADAFDGDAEWRIPTELLAILVVAFGAWDVIDCVSKSRSRLFVHHFRVSSG